MIGSIIINPGLSDSVRFYIYGSYSDVTAAQKEVYPYTNYTATGTVNVNSGQCDITIDGYPIPSKNYHYSGQFSFPE
jgi:hypothetical protein